MTEDDLLLSQIKDKIAECENNSIITSTDFLDLRKQGIAVSFLKHQKNVRWMLYGGYEDAERKVVVFLPYYVADFYDFIKENPDDEPFVTLRADKDNFSVLSHRDYLGALTGLGIRREKLGDIIVDEKGCFFFAKDSVVSFINQNFSSAGRGTITVSAVKDKPDFSKKVSVREICCFVATPRLDAVIAGVYSLSRSKAVEYIERGAVFVNDEQVLKPDFKLKSGDKLVLKGKGRAMIKDDSSKSKKGRIALIVDLFV